MHSDTRNPDLDCPLHSWNGGSTFGLPCIDCKRAASELDQLLGADSDLGGRVGYAGQDVVIAREDVRPRKGVCGFEFDGSAWLGAPQRLFRPHGLGIWGAPAGALVTQILIGQEIQVMQSASAVPARYFAERFSFAELRDALERDAFPNAKQWGEWQTIRLRGVMRVEVKSAQGKTLGAADGIEIAMWGLWLP